MKQINLNIKVEDNEVLEKSIDEMIHAQAKQIAREEFDKLLRAEVERIATNKVKSMTDDYGRSELKRMITNSVVEEIEKLIKYDQTEIKTILDESVELYFDKKFKHTDADGYAKKNMENIIKKTIAQSWLKDLSN